VGLSKGESKSLSKLEKEAQNNKKGKGRKRERWRSKTSFPVEVRRSIKKVAEPLSQQEVETSGEG